MNNKLKVLTALLGLIFFAAACSSDETSTSSDVDSETNAEAAPDETDVDQLDVEPAECPATDGSQEQRIIFDAPQQLCIDVEADYTALVTTSLGEFTIQLDPQRAPNTVNNFVTLARYKFYDGVTFHRVVPGFVIQGGDPEGTGAGGPGYSFEDELPASTAEYQIGTVAMANAGPDTNGSQFFVVNTETWGGEAAYSIFGDVTEGYDVVLAIEATGAGAEPVEIESVTITESAA